MLFKVRKTAGINTGSFVCYTLFISINFILSPNQQHEQVFSFLLAPVCAAAGAFAQMKSCCEPDNVQLVSSIKQTPGTLRMVKILDSINKHANPDDF